MTTTLYQIPMSSNSHCVMALITEAKLEDNIQFKAVDVMKGEQMAPEFVEKNPFHCLPTLEEGANEFTMWESCAILRYICNKHSLENFYPATPEQRARVDQVLDWRQCSLYPCIAKAAYPIMGWATNKSKMEEGKKMMIEQLKLFESYYLKDGKFAFGFDKPTIADLSVHSVFPMIKVTGIVLSEGMQKYEARMNAACPSFATHAAPLTEYIAKNHSGKAEKN